MSHVVIELPPHAEQTEFNLRRWAEVVKDPELQRYAGRVETDRYGQVIMNPPPAPKHGYFQAKIATLLSEHLPQGHIVTECPVSTADGVKGADVAWSSKKRWRELAGGSCFIHAPEICVEVLSPDNTERQIREKMELYFDAGAQEVWVCGSFGRVEFFAPGRTKSSGSKLCPTFPSEIEAP
jgi:Uma2 family endonuclease